MNKEMRPRKADAVAEGASLESSDTEQAFDDEEVGRDTGSLTDELVNLIDDGRTYAEAELGFQKARAGFVGEQTLAILIFAILALVLLIIALLTLAVGVMLALTPIMGIWAAMGLVISVLLVSAAVFLFKIKGKADLISSVFDGGSK